MTDQPQQHYPPVQQNVYVTNTTARRGVNHLLHLILTLCTCGLWGLVWVGVVVYEASRRRRP